MFTQQTPQTYGLGLTTSNNQKIYYQIQTGVYETQIPKSNKDRFNYGQVLRATQHVHARTSRGMVTKQIRKELHLVQVPYTRTQVTRENIVLPKYYQ